MKRTFCKPIVSICSSESLAYKIRVTKCKLVIIDDDEDFDSKNMIPDVKYLRLSDVYSANLYKHILSLGQRLVLLDSFGKERSDSKIQSMLSLQSQEMDSIDLDATIAISFTTGVGTRHPKGRRITGREMLQHFRALESQLLVCYVVVDNL
ncbi:hypothetical protein BdWA1_001460 [Babesia duncani]|uniref:Uncharacterized protein n=1 Tax=Babesia duncani TaxID=323732 RepID=A0AAD9UQZ0_9APIC|nr:hypothetical protein BdWA1_001460 [Babesia duncani]